MNEWVIVGFLVIVVICIFGGLLYLGLKND